jgi:hypothetical protein
VLIDYPTTLIRAVHVMPGDRVLAIHETGAPDAVVDWQITATTERHVGDPLTLHVTAAYRTPDGTTGAHEFEDGTVSVAVPRGRTGYGTAA